MRQEQVNKATHQKYTERDVESYVDEYHKPDTEALKDDLDSVLAEIDNVLEVNAEEFVSKFIQAGGE